MDALGLSQRCGNGGKGIGVKCVYGEYLYLIKFEGVFSCTASRRRFLGIHYSSSIRFFFGFVLFRVCACRQSGDSPILSETCRVDMFAGRVFFFCLVFFFLMCGGSGEPDGIQPRSQGVHDNQVPK